MASVASTMPILHALMLTPWAWGALRLVSGVCIVGLYMVIESWLNALAPNARRGKIFAAYMATTLGALAFFYGGLAFTVYGISVAHVNDLLEPARLLEAAGSLLLLHGIGAVIGPAAAGILMQRLGPGSLLVYFALVLTVLAGYALYRYKLVARPAPVEAHGYVPMADSSQALLQMDPRTEAPAQPVATPR
jgi:MFS family permease